MKLFPRDKPEIFYCSSEARTIIVRGFVEGKNTFFIYIYLVSISSLGMSACTVFKVELWTIADLFFSRLPFEGVKKSNTFIHTLKGGDH